jgi:hypothetical protein
MVWANPGVASWVRQTSGRVAPGVIARPGLPQARTVPSRRTRFPSNPSYMAHGMRQFRIRCCRVGTVLKSDAFVRLRSNAVVPCRLASHSRVVGSSSPVSGLQSQIPAFVLLSRPEWTAACYMGRLPPEIGHG